MASLPLPPFPLLPPSLTLPPPFTIVVDVIQNVVQLFAAVRLSSCYVDLSGFIAWSCALHATDNESV